MLTSTKRPATSRTITSSGVKSVAALFHSPLFTPWVDPQSSITSYVLTQRVAPFQQSFYFVNSSLTRDGRYYWFYCAFPPSGSANQGRSLAVIDFRKGCIHHYPETTFTDASPLVDEISGEAYWCAGLEIWKRSPEPDSKPVLVNQFPHEFARNRRPWRLATHMTFSADRRSVNLDVEIGNEWYIGEAPLNGDPFKLWAKFDHCYNHAQFSPTAPDLQLIAEDHSIHPITGEIVHYQNRLWLIRRGQPAHPIFPSPIGEGHSQAGGNPHYVGDKERLVRDERALHGHEWWSRDGRYVWYVHYGRGIERVPVDGNKPELMWPHKSLSHAHTDAHDQWIVADCIPNDDPEQRQVLFRNLATDRETAIVSRLPSVPAALNRYHVHPHPQFCMRDRLIAYTTLVRGLVDVAFVPVDELLEQTT